ncbi:WD repeat-containing protein 78-like [Centruroides sculpturatus]|uniref:WD repeat-containing protein 78-like n=1 Tax=Centruroides sculpturatus TaxID=218467 RepID=UPI000C6DBC52|nr:WD repeat-containing protein 78-like [Centruroides sculpturatus]
MEKRDSLMYGCQSISSIESSQLSSFGSSIKLGAVKRKAYKSSKKEDSQISSEILFPSVIDDDGNDVTPRPLFRFAQKHKKRSSNARLLNRSLGSSITGIDSIKPDSLKDDLSILHEVIDLEVEREESDIISSRIREISNPIPSVLEVPGYITLRETDTICILDVTDEVVMESNEEFEAVQKSNSGYDGKLKLYSTVGGLVNAESQTFLLTTKTKAQGTDIKHFKNAETQASEAIIYDETVGTREEDRVLETITLKSDIDNGLFKEVTISKENFMKSLYFMERAVNSVTFRDNIDCFKQITDTQLVSSLINAEQSEGKIDGNKNGTGINLEKLLVMTFQHAEDYIVTSLCWNEKNTDVLAIGYSHNKHPIANKGYVCCWCIKNCEVPERIYEAPYGVKCVKFCNMTPYLLAAGMYEGAIAIYDVRSTKPDAILNNLESSFRPIGIIWDLHWNCNEKEEKKYSVISISDDGNILQWTTDNKLECVPLMHLTKISNNLDKKEKSCFITQNESGYSINFNKQNSDIYITCSDQGNIYKCSLLYTDHYLSSYSFHHGPVYHVEWSPFLSDTFLSCGNDSTVAIWSENNTKPTKVIKIGKEFKAVIDASWSRTSPNTFATCTEDSIEIWDLSINLKDPITSVKPSYGFQYACIHYCPKGDILAAGFSNVVTLYTTKPIEIQTSQKIISGSDINI